MLVLSTQLCDLYSPHVAPLPFSLLKHSTPQPSLSEKVCVYKGEGTQHPSMLSPPGPGSVRLCNAMETKLPHSPSLPHPAS